MRYETSFAGGDENPISEGGVWSHNASNSWAKAKILTGVATAAALADSYNDCYALLSGFGNDVTLEATLFVDKDVLGTNSSEVELLLRMADGVNFVRGYELDCYVDGSAGSGKSLLIGVIRWNWDGNTWSWDTLSYDDGAFATSTLECFSGDVIKAVIAGDMISVYYNTVWWFNVTDASASKWASGQPGIGFYDHNNLRTTGFTHIRADDGLGGGEELVIDLAVRGLG